MRQDLKDAVSGVALTDRDEQLLDWLATWDQETTTALADLIWRAIASEVRPLACDQFADAPGDDVATALLVNRCGGHARTLPQSGNIRESRSTPLRNTSRETIAEAVRVSAVRRRVTSKALADRLGLSSAAMSRRMTGAVEFTGSELQAIAEFLEVPLERLVAAGDEVPA